MDRAANQGFGRETYRLHAESSVTNSISLKFSGGLLVVRLLLVCSIYLVVDAARGETRGRARAPSTPGRLRYLGRTSLRDRQD